MATHTYLLAFVSSRGHGNAVNTRPRPIDSAEEVADVQAWLRGAGHHHDAILTNVVLLKHDPDEVWVDKGTTLNGQKVTT
jgi:hypothetical protein